MNLFNLSSINVIYKTEKTENSKKREKSKR